MQITYHIEPDLAVAEFKAVLVASTLGERRPVHDDARLAEMLGGANLVVTARLDGVLVGVARALTDFAYCCYVSELAVDGAYQRQGIGQALLREVQARVGARVTVLLVAAPAAESYYPRIGMTHVKSAWSFPRSA